MEDFEVIIDPEKREKVNSDILKRLCIEQVKEDDNACYCTISLTSVPAGLKPILKHRQQVLMLLDTPQAICFFHHMVLLLKPHYHLCLAR